MILDDILPVLQQFNGVTFAAMDALTVVSLRGGKRNPMLNRVRKLAIGHRIMLFATKNCNGYENIVRRRLAAEGKEVIFNVDKLRWGEHLGNLPIIVHKNNHYLQTIFIGSGQIEYFLDNTPILKEEIEGLPIEDLNTGRQGLEPENKVIVRTFSLNSIRAIRLMNEEIT